MNRLLLRLRHRAAAFAHDLLWVPVAWIGAYWLRFSLEAVPDEYRATAFKLLGTDCARGGGVTHGPHH